MTFWGASKQVSGPTASAPLSSGEQRVLTSIETDGKTERETVKEKKRQTEKEKHGKSISCRAQHCVPCLYLPSIWLFLVNVRLCCVLLEVPVWFECGSESQYEEQKRSKPSFTWQLQQAAHCSSISSHCGLVALTEVNRKFLPYATSATFSPDMTGLTLTAMSNFTQLNIHSKIICQIWKWMVTHWSCFSLNAWLMST